MPKQAVEVRAVRSFGVVVTGTTAAHVRKALRMFASGKKPLVNGERELRHKQELLWSLVTRLVRRGKIRNRWKKKAAGRK